MQLHSSCIYIFTRCLRSFTFRMMYKLYAREYLHAMEYVYMLVCNVHEIVNIYSVPTPSETKMDTLLSEGRNSEFFFLYFNFFLLIIFVLSLGVGGKDHFCKILWKKLHFVGASSKRKKVFFFLQILQFRKIRKVPIIVE